MDTELKGKTVFVAGASKGIGFGIARAFLAEGAKVCISGRGKDSLKDAEDSLAKEFGADNLLAVSGDMTATDDLVRALDATEDKLGPLWCAVANVGIGRAPMGFDISDEDWDADIAQNFTGSMRLAREAIRRMRGYGDADREGASVIFISSIAGVDAMGTPLPYATTKAALNHCACQLAKFVGKTGIRVNSIAPGNIMFEGGAWEKIVASDPDGWNAWIDREVAMQRFGKVEEIADAAVFLASRRA
ncbi:MAG: SDR family oxidoreductase, partial [Alphaproteobacteria bacterium]|nr:SDR family oxidoreductase [Alphaproteobacteria bacterium]